jgi:signal transduction histidine kinase
MNTPEISEPQAHLELAAEALRKADERAIAGQLALELMHEIRNPLEALCHLTYLAQGEADNPEVVRSYMRLADEQTTILRQIVDQTLGFVRPSAAPKPIDLIVVAEAALRIHQQTIAAKKVNLVKNLPDKLVAYVYTSEMLQAISNLIVNALDAIPTEGTLHLRFRRYGDRLHLLIADNGHGIPAENAERIFQPFFTTKGEHGTGLGLAVTRKIIERHKGKIRVRSSVRPGRSGTIFKVVLPSLCAESYASRT